MRFSTVIEKRIHTSKQTPFGGSVCFTRHFTVPGGGLVLPDPPVRGDRVKLTRRLGTVEWRVYRGKTLSL